MGFWLWLELQLLAIFVQSCHALLSRNLLMVVVLDLILGTDNKNTKKEGMVGMPYVFQLCGAGRKKLRLHHQIGLGSQLPNTKKLFSCLKQEMWNAPQLRTRKYLIIP